MNNIQCQCPEKKFQIMSVSREKKKHTGSYERSQPHCKVAQGTLEGPHFKPLGQGIKGRRRGGGGKWNKDGSLTVGLHLMAVWTRRGNNSSFRLQHVPYQCSNLENKRGFPTDNQVAISFWPSEILVVHKLPQSEITYDQLSGWVVLTHWVLSTDNLWTITYSDLLAASGLSKLVCCKSDFGCRCLVRTFNR